MAVAEIIHICQRPTPSRWLSVLATTDNMSRIIVSTLLLDSAQILISHVKALDSRRAGGRNQAMNALYSGFSMLSFISFLR